METKIKSNKTLDRCAKEAYDLEYMLTIWAKKYQDACETIKSLELYKKDWYLKQKHIENLELIIEQYKKELELSRQHSKNLESLLSKSLFNKISDKIKHHKER